ncbi:hypothetical protein PL10110_450072 [Planktothrix agardhii]|nr:hypothetical protein PL10110_450072 [Planktothrix agardhii]
MSCGHFSRVILAFGWIRGIYPDEGRTHHKLWTKAGTLES